MVGPGNDDYELSQSSGKDFDSMAAVLGSWKEFGTENKRERLHEQVMGYLMEFVFVQKHYRHKRPS